MAVEYLLAAIVLFLLVRRFLPVKGLAELSPEQVAELLRDPQGHVFIDVREAFEYKRGHIRGFRNIPLSELHARLHEIPKDRPVVITCHSGMRSRKAGKLLKKHGYRQLSHLKTGISGWQGMLAK